MAAPGAVNDSPHRLGPLQGPRLGAPQSGSTGSPRTGIFHPFVLSIDPDSSGSPSKDSSRLTLKRPRPQRRALDSVRMPDTIDVRAGRMYGTLVVCQPIFDVSLLFRRHRPAGESREGATHFR